MTRTQPRFLTSVFAVILGAVLGASSWGVRAEQLRTEDLPFSGRIDVTGVSVTIEVVDRDGNVPSDLTPADFEVLEDGKPQTILSVTPQPSPEQATATEGPATPGWDWQVVIYFDQKLASRRGSREAALGLAGMAGELTGLGSVQILAARAEIEEVLPATRDEGAVREALERVAKKYRGHEELVKIRRQFLRDLSGGAIEQEQIVAISGAGGGAGGDARPVDRTTEGEARERMLIRASLRQEIEIIDRQTGLLTRWAERDRRSGPRLLVLIHDGFDVEPRDFYLGLVSPGIESAMGAELAELSFGPLRQRMTRLLSAQGWIVMPLAVGRAQAAGTNTVAEGGAVGASNSDQLGILRRAPSFLQGQALAPLRSLAEESGGELLVDESALPAAITRLSQRVRLDYQVARPPDGQVHELEVVARRPGLTVKQRRWIASETLEEIAEARAQRLAEGGDEKGDLPLASLVLIEDGDPSPRQAGAGGKLQGTVATRVDLAALGDARPMLAATAVRVSLVIFFPDRPPFVHHQVLQSEDLSQGEEWKHAATLSFPADTARVVVVVEELATGSWGGAVAPLVRRKPS